LPLMGSKEGIMHFAYFEMKEITFWFRTGISYVHGDEFSRSGLLWFERRKPVGTIWSFRKTG
jgi:hypothetical protein